MPPERRQEFLDKYRAVATKLSGKEARAGADPPGPDLESKNLTQKAAPVTEPPSSFGKVTKASTEDSRIARVEAERRRLSEQHGATIPQDSSKPIVPGKLSDGELSRRYQHFLSGASGVFKRQGPETVAFHLHALQALANELALRQDAAQDTSERIYGFGSDSENSHGGDHNPVASSGVNETKLSVFSDPENDALVRLQAQDADNRLNHYSKRRWLTSKEKEEIPTLVKRIARGSIRQGTTESEFYSSSMASYGGIVNSHLEGVWQQAKNEIWSIEMKYRQEKFQLYKSRNENSLPLSQFAAVPQKRGYAPLGLDGFPVELHHDGREAQSDIIELLRSNHRLGDNYKKRHPEEFTFSKINRGEFRKTRYHKWAGFQDWVRLDHF